MPTLDGVKYMYGVLHGLPWCMASLNSSMFHGLMRIAPDNDCAALWEQKECRREFTVKNAKVSF